jgi:hypothetical protein
VMYCLRQAIKINPASSRARLLLERLQLPQTINDLLGFIAHLCAQDPGFFILGVVSEDLAQDCPGLGGLVLANIIICLG